LVDGIKWDLDPVGGYMVSTKKTITVMDMNGKKYLVTVEEKG
jgi:YHS domain-containing protein